jgi:hypothetical protein
MDMEILNRRLELARGDSQLSEENGPGVLNRRSTLSLSRGPIRIAALTGCAGRPE